MQNIVDVVRDQREDVLLPRCIAEAEKNVAKVRENLKVAQSTQKSYADKQRRELSFEVEDHVYLKCHHFGALRGFASRENLPPGTLHHTQSLRTQGVGL